MPTKRLVVAVAAVLSLLLALVAFQDRASSDPNCPHGGICGPVSASARAKRSTTSPPVTTPQGPGDCQGGRQGATRGGLMGFAHGYRYAQIDGTSTAQTYVQAFLDTGALWWRMNMESWNTAEFDDLLARLPANVCVLGNISSTPQGWQDPPDHQAWANAAAQEVARYKNRIHVWEIWNEPNLSGFWPSRNSDSWADLVKRTYAAIKAVDPTATVLGSCCAPQGDGTDPYNAVNWWTRVYAWNGGTLNGLADGIAHHPYLYPLDPTDPANFQTWSGFYQTYLLHNLMASHGDGAKRIWGTEAGAPTGCSLSECVSLSDEAARIPREFDIWIDQWGAFTGPLFFHQLQNQADQPTSSHEHWMGIIDTSFGHKDPEWTAWNQYAARTN